MDAFARIASLHTLKYNSNDYILITTEDYKLYVISHDAAIPKFTLEYATEYKDMGRISDSGQICALDPRNRFVCIHAFQARLSFVHFDDLVRSAGQRKRARSLKREYTVNLYDELQVLDICALDSEQVKIVILYQDSRVKKCRVYNVIEQEIKKISDHIVDDTASLLIPLDNERFAVCADTKIQIFDNGNKYDLEGIDGSICCFDRIEKDNLILASSVGDLYAFTAGKIPKLDKLGSINIPTSIACLNAQLVFVASHYGDSQLIRLGKDVQVLDSYENLAPIVDFCVKESDGLSQIITCSNAYKHGTLKIIQNGIGVNEITSIDADGIGDIFRVNINRRLLLLMNFIAGTEVLEYVDDGVVAVQNDLCVSEQTLVASELEDGVVQVTNSSIRYLSKDLELVKTIQLKNVKTADVEHGNCAVYDEKLILIYDSKGKLIGDISTEHNVSGMNLSQIGNSLYLTVCFWSVNKLVVYDLFNKKAVCEEELDEHPRSVILIDLEGSPYLFVGFGTGKLLTYEFTPTGLQNKNSISVGSGPITFRKFVSGEKECVFCTGDRPLLTYVNNQRLVYNTVNLRDVFSVCNFPVFPNTVAYAVKDKLVIASIENIQKLQVQSVQLGSMARRVVYSKESKSIGVICTHGTETGDFFCVLDDTTYDVKFMHNFERFELVQAIETYYVDEKCYFCVGTVFSIPNDDKKRSKLHIFEAHPQQSRAFIQIKEHDLTDSLYSICFIKKWILVSVGHRIEVFDLQLNNKSSNFGFTNVLKMYEQYGQVLAGDLQKSVCVFKINDNGEIVDKMRHFETSWTTSCSHMDTVGGYYVVADANFNVYIVRNANDETLQTCASINVGELVNCMKPATFGDEREIPTVIYTTVSGAIGIIAQIQEEEFTLLKKLQAKMAKTYRPPTGVDFHSWRQFRTEYEKKSIVGFIDGDLVEKILEYTPDEREFVMNTKTIPEVPVYSMKLSEEGDEEKEEEYERISDDEKKQIMEILERMVRIH